MKKLKLYLETSVWNFYFADDAPELRDITLQFFKNIEGGYFDIYISEIVLQEIEQAAELKFKSLLELIKRYSPVELEVNPESVILAREYIEKLVLPINSYEDALHAAISTVQEMDVLMSWNMKHLANLSRKQKINAVNVQNKYYKSIEIVTPREVADYES